MSLDVYLMGQARTERCRCSECGDEHGRVRRECLYSANITHNLGPMASAAGIYEHLWRPEEVGVERSDQIVEPLSLGLSRLERGTDEFRRYDASNGWGTYPDFVRFVREYLDACRKHPGALVEVSR